MANFSNNLIKTRLSSRPLDTKSAKIRCTTFWVLVSFLIPLELYAQTADLSGAAEQNVHGAKNTMGFPYNKSWRKYEIPTNPNVPLDQKSKIIFVDTLKRLGEGFSLRSEYEQIKKFTSKNPESLDWRIHSGGLTAVPTGEEANIGEFGKFFGHSAEKLAVSDLKGKYHYDQYASFHGEIGFNRAKNESTTQSNVKYGLILTEIKNEGVGPSYAALSDWESEVQHAPKAKIIWQVGSVQEDSLSKEPFKVENHKVKTSEIEESSVFLSQLPTPRARITLKPENFDRFSVFGQNNNAAMWRVDTEQVDGLYQFSTFHRSDGGQTQAEHKFAMPLLSKKYWIARVYDQNVELKESHVKTKVNHWNNAELAARFNHIEERWVVDVTKEIAGSRWGLIAKSKAESAKTDPKVAQENYAMNYNFDF